MILIHVPIAMIALKTMDAIFKGLKGIGIVVVGCFAIFRLAMSFGGQGREDDRG
ncbi:MAG: hypothetical protein AAF479_07250 [Pseudomonadota bacterium]